MKQSNNLPANMRGPKKSDDAHNHWNYGMSEEQLAEYIQKKQVRNTDQPTLIAAE